VEGGEDEPDPVGGLFAVADLGEGAAVVAFLGCEEAGEVKGVGGLHFPFGWSGSKWCSGIKGLRAREWRKLIKDRT